MAERSNALAPYEGLVLQAYQDLKMAARYGFRKLQKYNNHRQLVSLISMMRATESGHTKTIAFQTDGLSAPLWRALLGHANCDRQDVLSWSKTEPMLALRDRKICSETGSPVGSLQKARHDVLSSRKDIIDDFMCVVSRTMGWEVLDKSLDRPKLQALKQRIGAEFEGSFAGKLSLSNLFCVSEDDTDISGAMTGKEIPIGVAMNGERLTVMLLLSGNEVILFRGERKVRKYLGHSQRESINYLIGKRRPLAEPLAEFIYQAYLAFRSVNESADAYLTAMRFVQKFLSYSTENLTIPVDDANLSRCGTVSLRKDAVRLQHIITSSYVQAGTQKYIDLSKSEISDVHKGQASLSSEQHSRIFHDLTWQEQVYDEAPVDHSRGTDMFVATFCDDENRDRMTSKMYSEHEKSIRKKRAITVKVNDKESLKLNLAVMCYNRLTHNEYATVGFETSLKKHLSTTVCTDKYKAVYTPHSEAAVLYFDVDVFSGLKLQKYQPNKGAQESILGLVSVLHDQLDKESKTTVNNDVYDFLQKGLHNITVVQDLILTAMRTKLTPTNEFKLRMSDLFVSVARHTDNIRIRKWLEREVMGFLALNGVPNDKSTVGASAVYDAYSDYYEKTVAGIEVTVDKTGTLSGLPVRLSTESGSYLMCDGQTGKVLRIKKGGKEIRDPEELQGKLQLLCCPGKEPTKEYMDVLLPEQTFFG